MVRPLVFVCQGRTCSRSRDHDALVRAICKVGDVQLVRCQKICHGSVVGIALNQELEWFERVRSPKLRRLIRKAAVRGKRKGLDSSLRKRRITSYSGRPPR